MAFIDPVNKEVVGKIVYWGAPGSGKSENFQSIRAASADSIRSLRPPDPFSGCTEMLELTVGEMHGFRVRIHLWAPHGMSDLGEASRILGGTDAAVLVVNSETERAQGNTDASVRLSEALHALPDSPTPILVQYNKRDVPGAQPLDSLRASLTVTPTEEMESVATRSEGTLDTLGFVLRAFLGGLKGRLTPYLG